ncbi:MAG: Rne/Rng family ribonuclease [Rickettsiales bacterium]
MAKRILIDALHSEETRVVIADKEQIYDFDSANATKKQLKGNIYLAKITRVEPSLQAAFVEYGGGKQGFLPFSEIHTDYYQIPFSDKQKLLEEAEREEQEAATCETEKDKSNDEDDKVDSKSDNSDENNDDNSIAEKIPSYIALESIKSSEHIEIPEDDDGNESSDNENNKTSDDNGYDNKTNSEGSSDSEDNVNIESVDSTERLIDNPDNIDNTSDNGDAQDSEIETIDNDSNDDERSSKHKQSIFLRRYKIQEVIRRGQVVLVQVIKEERGNKGVSLTTFLSLAGRYCVLMPNSPKDGGISRKISNSEDRKRLKAISNEFRFAEGMSVIIRTAGMGRKRVEIKRDFDYLVKLWNTIREETLKSNAPALIYEESDVVKRAIRDQYNSDIDEIVIEGKEAYKTAREFMKLLLPSHLPKIKNHDSKTPIFYEYNVEEQLIAMHDPVVKMRSGAYLVINPTEAMISIDVNSGKATGERNIEETALKTNLEAAEEIAKQLRLRDLAGLVVIDFIDMVEARNRRAIEKALKNAMREDRAKIQLGRISPFGLLEMSRQRLRSSVSEINTTQCPHCLGSGIIRSNESMGIQLVRAIEKEAGGKAVSSLKVYTSQNVAMYMLNSKRKIIQEIEDNYDVEINISINPELGYSEFSIEKMRLYDNNSKSDRNEQRRQRRKGNKQYSKDSFKESNDDSDLDDNDNLENETSENEIKENNDNKRRGRRRNNRNRGNKDKYSNKEIRVEEDGNKEGEQPQPVNTDVENNKDTDSNNRRRSRRKWRDRGTDKKLGDTNDNSENNNDNAKISDDAMNLPAFASDLSQQTVPATPDYKPYHDYKKDNVVEMASNKNSDSNSEKDTNNDAKVNPPRRGWWQKMISLDD